jgi:hypothetical protein
MLRHAQNRWIICVVQDHNPTHLQHFIYVKEVYQSMIEGMPSIDNSCLNFCPLGEKSRQSQFRWRLVQFNHVLVSCTLYILQADIVEDSLLIWVDDDVLALVSIRQQSIAREKRRNTTAEANFK